MALTEGAEDLSVVAAGSPSQANLLEPVDLVVIHAGAEAGEAGPFAQTLPALRARLPDTPVVVLAARHSAADVLNALRLGVRGYLSHELSPQELSRTLRRISDGEVFVPAAAPDRSKAEEERASPALPDVSHPALTPRQSDVLVRIRQGKSNKVIAFELGMQESTVKVHVRNILKQLGATNRTEAVYLADLR